MRKYSTRHFSIMYLFLKINVLLWHCSFLSCQSITILKWNMRAKRSGSRVLGCIIYIHTSQLDLKCELCLWLAWLLTTYSLSLFIISELFLNVFLCSPSLPSFVFFTSESWLWNKVKLHSENWGIQQEHRPTVLVSRTVQWYSDGEADCGECRWASYLLHSAQQNGRLWSC